MITTINYRGVDITYSDISMAAVATIKFPMVKIIEGKVQMVLESREIQGHLRNVKKQIYKYHNPKL